MERLPLQQAARVRPLKDSDIFIAFSGITICIFRQHTVTRIGNEMALTTVAYLREDRVASASTSSAPASVFKVKG